jgi:uncharacterized protein (TIGR02001 family)
MRNADRTARAMRRVLLAALVMAAGQAPAQVGGSLAIVSDYRYRGATLSHGRAEAQLHLGIDGADGWYGGGFVSGVDLRGEYSAHLQLLVYAGRAARDETGTAWDGGIIASVFPQAAAYNYFEAYAGFTGALFSGRLSASPDYFGSGAATLYAECNASIDLGHAMRVETHAGYLHASSHPATRVLYHADGPDLSLGLSAGISRARLTLNWTVARQAGNAWALKLALPL